MARRFKFRLETVLKIRKQREDAAKRVVAERLRQVAAVQDETAALQRQMDQEIAGFRQSHSAGRIDITVTRRHRHWLIHLDQGILMAHGRLAELHRALAGDRAILTEARKQVRILEKLEERQRERYRQELTRDEARENDEIGNALYLRQKAAQVG
ncbi:MAG: flagellar export protein FliJ [Phycisphaerae bacterium]|nr:flagellar export protein FliJ [Phycisphaerae bacterium]